jgi:hypothetical protein
MKGNQYVLLLLALSPAARWRLGYVLLNLGQVPEPSPGKWRAAIDC